MDPSPWSAYTQHYSRLGGAGSSQLNDLAHPSSRQDHLGSYGGAGATHPLLLPTHHPGLNQGASDPGSFNTMGLLTSGYDSSLLPGFQHSPKGHFTGLSQGPSFFKSVNKDDLSDLRGGFRGSAQDSGGGNAIFDSHVASGSWRHPAMPQSSSCGPFGILPHEAVMTSRNSDRNGEKFSQQVPSAVSRPPRTNLSYSEQQDRGYGSILPSPSRPPSSFVDPNTVPHSASLTTQGDSYFGDGYYCSKSSFESYGSSSLATNSSSPADSQSAFPHTYGMEKSEEKGPLVESFSANTSVIVSHLHMQNGQASRPGVISTVAGSVCQGSPNIPPYNYQYPSPSSQSPSVVQSPQNLSCSQTYSQQHSPAVMHSPYPSMNTPAPASTPAHVTPPTSIGQAYVPSSVLMNEGSPHGCTPSSVITSNSANYSVGSSDRSTPGSGKPLGGVDHGMDLNSSHYVSPISIPPSDLHDEGGCMVDMVSDEGKLLDSELSAMNAMVEKTRLPDPSANMDRRMDMVYESHQEMQMVFDDVGLKEGMMMQPNYHTQPGGAGGGVIHNSYQPMPVVRKRGRPKGSVNKRGGKRGTRRASRRGSAGAFAGDGRRGLHQPVHQQQTQQPPPSGCSPRLNVVRGLHGRILTTGARKNSMTTTPLCDMDFNPASCGEQSMHPGQSGPTLRDLRRQSEEYHSSMSLESKVFNFEEHSSSEVSPPFGKMNMDPSSCRDHDGMLVSPRGRSPAYRDLKYMDLPIKSEYPHHQHHHHQQQQQHHHPYPLDDRLMSAATEPVCDQKSKNFLSIEDDLGFLAELPPIDTDAITSDGHGNKTSSKEPGGGFLQSFLSFIEGSNEPQQHVNPQQPQQPTQQQHPTHQVGGGMRGRRGMNATVPGGVGRVRRSRGGGRGRPPGTRGVGRRGAYSNGQDNGNFEWRPSSENFNSSCHPKSKKGPEEDAEKESANLDSSSEFLGCSGLQKDVVVPNPEAPSFSSDEDDNNDNSGIADSVAFVIRRLSEDEPPGGGENAKKSQKSSSSAEGAKRNNSVLTTGSPTNKTVPTVTIYKRKGRKTSKLGGNDAKSNSNSLSDDVEVKMEADNNCSFDSYEFCEASTRRTSMRRCKEEVLKKRRELIIKKRKQNGEVDDGGSSQDELDNMSDDPAWTPSSKNPAADGLKPVTTFHTRDRKRHSKRPKSHKKPGVVSVVRDGRARVGKQQEEEEKSSKVKPEDDDSICECHFRLGDFVMAVAESENRNPPIWQIEGNHLLQRFEPFEEDGRVLYRNASSYSAWNPSVRSRYRGVTVRILYTSRAYTIAEYVGLSEIPQEETNGEVAENVEMHPQQENFEVFLQTLISQVLDPNFIAEIIKENDEYFLSHLQGIAELTRKKKSGLLEEFRWDARLQECAELYPCVNIVARKLEENCQVCQQVTAQQTVQFHGQLYDQVTLGNQSVEAQQNRETGFSVCGGCSHTVILYHRLHHHKYNFILKCRTKVDAVKSDDKESHVVLEECLQDTAWVNEMFQEMQAMWSACDKPR